jgi:hypothetical protein
MPRILEAICIMSGFWASPAVQGSDPYVGRSLARLEERNVSG